MHSRKEERGFTLIELLIVIGIIGFLAAAVLVAVDPVKRIQDSRDARRYSEANGLLNAMLTKQVDDRALYAGAPGAGIVTSQTNAQVIVSSDVGVACDTGVTGVSNYPGCNKALNTTAGTAIAGTVTTVGTAMTGSTTTFTTSLKVGDVLYVTLTPAKKCVVSAIASDTALTCATAPATDFAGDTAIRASKNCVANLSDTMTSSGTATSSGAVVTGTGTAFTTWVSVGDVLTSGTSTCTVQSIASATSLTCTATVTPAFSASVLTITKKNPLVPNYIASLPVDPRGAGEGICVSGCTTNAAGITTLGTTNTGYYVQRSAGNRLEVGACAGEQTTSISVKR